jgi:preprotein translocase subunit YajC
MSEASMYTVLLLLAQAEVEGGAPARPPTASDPLSFMIPIMAIFFLAYFLILRPSARKQEQERLNMLNALKKNDKVITSGGLIGTVAAVKEKEDEVTLKVDESANVRLRVTKSSIVRVIPAQEAGKETREGGA